MKTTKLTSQKTEKSSRINTILSRMSVFFNSKKARILVLTLFSVQAVFLALVIHPGTPPDEDNHWHFINFYASHSLSPIFNEQEPTLNLGDKTREPDYLYHYAMSLVVRVLPLDNATERIIIRLFSVVFGLLSLMFLAKVLSKLKVSESVTSLTILLLSQLSMVLMMSAVVNNDALVWLGMTVGLWLLLEIWEKTQLSHVLGLLLIPAYGGLVKRTLLPIAVVIVIVAAVLVWQHRKSVWQQCREAYKKPGPLVIVLAALLVLGLGLSAERIGGNIIRYDKIAPSCEDVQGDIACYGFWLNIRTRYLAELPPEKPIATPLFAARWAKESVKNVLDIQTQWWRHEVIPPKRLTSLSLLLLGVGIVLGLLYDGRRMLKNKDQDATKRLVVLAIGMAYIASHLLANLSMYHSIHFFGIALNGRYTLAGLFPVIGLVVFYWAKLLRKWPLLQLISAILIIGLLATYSGFSLLVRNPQLFKG